VTAQPPQERPLLRDTDTPEIVLAIIRDLARQVGIDRPPSPTAPPVSIGDLLEPLLDALPAQWEAADDRLCYWCQTRPATSVDHLNPRSRGGTDDPENLVPACGHCNSQKRAKTAGEYRAWLWDDAHPLPTAPYSDEEWTRDVGET
jgi:5-methylcytosine-specific restriction endonuclease McrA